MQVGDIVNADEEYQSCYDALLHILIAINVTGTVSL